MQQLGRQPTFQIEYISQGTSSCSQNQEGFHTQRSSFSTYSPILMLYSPAPSPVSLLLSHKA